MATRVIDLSHWQTIPSSLVPAAESGIWGAIHKATEGSGGRDDKYGARRHLAHDAGLLFGAYHFLRPGNMADQARIFTEYAAPDPAMLLAADHEDSRVSLGNLEDWLVEVEGLTGIRPIIYSGHVLKDQLGGARHPVLNQDNYKLWIAQYASKPTLPPGWTSYFLWQFSDQATVPGINPPTDVNDFQGTREELEKAWMAAGPAPAPPPEGTAISPKAFQAALAEAGFYQGEIDGLSGPLTEAAVGAWFTDGDPLAIEVEE